MADYDSGLPIRSEADGLDERVHVKIVDGTTPAQRATVDTDNNLHVEVHGNDPAGIDRVIKTSETGETAIDGTYDAANNTNPSNIGVVAQERNAAASDIRQTMKPTAVRGTAPDTAVSLDIALHDEAGNPYTQNNPLPVSMEESEGDEINNYNTASAILADASSNHDYTVSASRTLVIDRLWASASGKLKIELQIETGVATDVFTTRAVGFNSTANPNIDLALNKTIKVATGVRVRIIRTNRDNQPQDVYSTLMGIEKA